MKKNNIIFAIFIYTIFPLSSVFMKYASAQENLILKLFLFGMSIFSLGVFSILWQKLLKRVDLVKAYLFKSTTIIWNVIYGILLFSEKITVNMILGIVITTIGVMITIYGGKEENVDE